MSIINVFFIVYAGYSIGDCIKFTIPNSEGIPMLIIGKEENRYKVFYRYPQIGDINFTAIAKKLEQDTQKIDKSYCKLYRE